MKKQYYDIIIIGGGHAGIEAACAGIRMGYKVAIFTMKESNIGEISCNPSIGGIGKGTIVKEIDALDGVMGKITDISSTSFKILNTSKGPAVWGFRSQIDRKLYKQNLIEFLKSNYPDLDIVYDEVLSIETNIINDKKEIKGIIARNTGFVSCKSCIVSTGTFLGSKMSVGFNTIVGGRIGEDSSSKLLESIKDLGFTLNKLKTGTPPRLYRDSVNLSKLEIQSIKTERKYFSILTEDFKSKVDPCYITRTNKKAHDILRYNFDKSPVLSNAINVKGPRYCPSIEDKIRRFGDKDGHTIFLEPEGFDSDLFYPMGISTSMPADIQLQFLRCIDGLESVEVKHYGYLVQYYFVNPVGLHSTMETKLVKNLFFAGQINGTTGYEEAGGQGIIAGINAALNIANKPPFILSRNDSFIGVMIDDLVIIGVDDEPYRMFTSRAENRLLIRSDNSHFRLTEKGIDVGCITEPYKQKYLSLKEDFSKAKYIMSNTIIPGNMLQSIGLSSDSIGRQKSVAELISMGCNIKDLYDISSDLSMQLSSLDKESVFTAVTDYSYKSHVARQSSDINQLSKAANYKLASDFDYSIVKSLSAEVVEKLNKVKPDNLEIAMRIPGVTPAAILAIMYYLSKQD